MRHNSCKMVNWEHFVTLVSRCISVPQNSEQYTLKKNCYLLLAWTGWISVLYCTARSLVKTLRHPGTCLLLFDLLRSVVCSWIDTVVLQSWYVGYGISYHTCVSTYPNNMTEGGRREEFSPRRLPNSEFIKVCR